MIAHENSGHSVVNDFPKARKIVEAGATRKTIADNELSRYACYSIIRNGDLRKREMSSQPLAILAKGTTPANLLPISSV